MNQILLEDRLIEFTVEIYQLSKQLDQSHISNHLANQITRSALSVSLNFGEARAASSRKDFIHKLRIVLKELRETHVGLKIIQRAKISKNQKLLNQVYGESNELVSIFTSSLKTLEKKT